MGDAEDGKSRAINRARMSVHCDHEYIQNGNINSDRALDKMFPGDALMGSSAAKFAPSWVVAQDELRILMDKMCIQGSSLASALCTLFYEEKTANADKSGHHGIAVKLSMLGALKIKDPEEFKELWRSATVNGLYSRYIFCPGPKHWEWDDLWKLPPFKKYDWPDQAPPNPLSTTVIVDPAAFAGLGQWAKEGERRGRLAELAKRVAIISAAVNNDTEITPACADAALHFAIWQAQVRAIYSPTEAQNPDAIVTNLIMDAFKEHHDRCPSQWLRFRSLMIEKNWARRYGSGLVNRVKKSLVDDGFLEEEMEEDERGNLKRMRHPRYRLDTRV
jgi:hypothetical protein